MNSYPKISIVTPSFNQGKYLEQTILSIINQKYPNLEYIIIDGASSDNSQEIIKKYESHLNYWVSEKDKGQSNAINKGLEKATGDLFNWINSDDFLEEGALFRIAEAYKNHSEKKVFCFRYSTMEKDIKKEISSDNNPADPDLCFCEPVISQPSMFYAMDAVRKIGNVSELLHFSMDREWFWRCLFSFGAGAVFSGQEYISVSRIHEETKTAKGYDYFLNDVGNMLYSMAEQSGLNQYCTLLKKRYKINENYIFNFENKKEHSLLIEKIIIYFLLKWGRLIYTKEQFLFAKELLKCISFASFILTQNEKVWLKELQSNASPINWFIFKLKRKLNIF